MVVQGDENPTQHVVHEIQQAHDACQLWDETMANYLQVSKTSFHSMHSQ